jgi:hypothetical protein
VRGDLGRCLEPLMPRRCLIFSPRFESGLGILWSTQSRFGPRGAPDIEHAANGRPRTGHRPAAQEQAPVTSRGSQMSGHGSPTTGPASQLPNPARDPETGSRTRGTVPNRVLWGQRVCPPTPCRSPRVHHDRAARTTHRDRHPGPPSTAPITTPSPTRSARPHVLLPVFPKRGQVPLPSR